MKATNLDLIGPNKWGQTISKRIYSDDSGNKYVATRGIGTLRSRMVPYKTFAAQNLEYNYIMERRDTIRRCKHGCTDY